MNVPNLTRIVDTYIPIRQPNRDAYLDQLRQEVVRSIRKLQKDGLLSWFSFLIHGPDMLDGRDPLTAADCTFIFALNQSPRSTSKNSSQNCLSISATRYARLCARLVAFRILSCTTKIGHTLGRFMERHQNGSSFYSKAIGILPFLFSNSSSSCTSLRIL